MAKFEEMREEASSIGRIQGFYAEYMNEPMEDVDQPFKYHMVQYTESLPANCNVRYFATFDLAYSKGSKNDCTGIAIGATDPDNNLYVLEANKFKYNVEEAIALLFTVWDNYKKLGLPGIHIEAHTAFHQALEGEMRRRNEWIPIWKLTPEGVSKIDRIRSLQPALKYTKFFPNRCDTTINEMLAWNEYSTIDDATDALAYLRKVAIPSYRTIVPTRIEDPGQRLIAYNNRKRGGDKYRRVPYEPS
jgi:hypothetical protein